MFEEPIFEDDAFPRIDLSRSPEGVTIVVPILPTGLSDAQISKHQRKLVDDLVKRIGPGPLIAWYYTPMSLTFSRHLAADVVVYDNMDELSAFLGASPRLLAAERDLFDLADVVFTGGMSLYEAKRRRHHNVHGFPSSIDTRHFSQARYANSTEPADQSSIGGPRLGFFGVIDERMDIDLVGKVAAMKPEWQFVMIGPVVKIDPGTLPRLPNIHWLGGKQYKELPSYLSGWNVGIMPFALNESTRFISPTKTPEFLAAGVPVVSTPIRDVVRPYGDSGLVEIALGAEAFCSAAENLLTRPRAKWLQEVDRFLATNSWDKTWDAMNGTLQKAAALKRSGATSTSRLQAPAEGVAHV